jgi:chromodomain-helicase-DNA-binding protein 7
MKRALHCWTKEEQRAVVELLLPYEYPNADDFTARFGTTRNPDDVAAFVGLVLAFCAGDEDVIRRLPEGIPADRAALVRSRVQIFETARELAKRRSFSYEDEKTLQAVARGGFLEITDDGAQAKIIHLISDLRRQVGLGPVKRVARPVDVDGNPRPLLPLFFTRCLVIVELGTVVVDRVAFHSQKYIYPSGFVSEKCFTSVVDPTAQGWYRSLVLDTGEPWPLFRVELKGDPEVHFDAATPSGAWVAVARAIAKRRVELKLPLGTSLNDRAAGLTVSGPEYYGFADPRTMRLIESLPGADACKYYQTRSRA